MPDPSTIADIEWGTSELRRRARLWRTFHNYYIGRHRLAFATKEWRNEFGDLFSSFSDNLCPTVIHAVRNRLSVMGFTVPGEELATEETTDPLTGEIVRRRTRTLGRVGGEEDAADRAWDAWNRNRMDRRQKTLYKSALIGGLSYALVWPDPVTGKAVVYPHDMDRVAVRYDDEQPDRVILGMKGWIEQDKRARVNLYYEDRIEKYVTKRSSRGALPEKGDAFVPYEPDDGSGSVVTHDLGRVPIIEFGYDDGKSRLSDVLPLQDALNKSVADMLVTMEFQAIPQRYVVGYTPEYGPDGKPIVPFAPGSDRIWGVQDPQARFGQFDPANLTQFVTVHDSFRGEVARVSSTPLHYLLLSGNFPSGEALRAAEAPLEAVSQDTRDSFGPSLEELMQLVLRIEGTVAESLSTLWRESVARGMKELAETIEIKRGLGVSKRQGLRELGYSDAEIEEMESEDLEAELGREAAGRPEPIPMIPGASGLSRIERSSATRTAIEYDETGRPVAIVEG